MNSQDWNVANKCVPGELQWVFTHRDDKHIVFAFGQCEGTPNQRCVVTMYYYRPQRSSGQGNIFTPVCHSVHRGGLPQCMLGCHPLGLGTPRTTYPIRTMYPPGLRTPLDYVPPPPRLCTPWTTYPLDYVPPGLCTPLGLHTPPDYVPPPGLHTPPDYVPPGLHTPQTTCPPRLRTP